MVKYKGDSIEMTDGDEIILGDNQDFRIRFDGSQDRLEFADLNGNEAFLTKGDSGDLLLVGADHGQLAGLGDDDHTQYLLTDGSRTMTGNLDLGANNILDSGDTIWDAVNEYVPLSAFESDTITVTAGTGLTGGGSVTLGGSITLSFDTQEVRDIAGGYNARGPDKYYYDGSIQYTTSNSAIADEVKYSQVYLYGGDTFSKLQMYFTASTTADFDFGIYDDNNGEPGSLLESSGVTSLSTNGDEFLDIPLSANWTVPSSGYYWTAYLTGNTQNCKQSAGVNSNVDSKPPFHPLFQETRTTTNGLPSSATPSVGTGGWPWYALVRA